MTAADRIDAAAVLMLTPFVGGVCFLVTLAVAYVLRIERLHRRNPFAPSPQTQAARGELHERVAALTEREARRG